MRNSVQLITYADRLAGNIRGLSELLRGEFAGLFGGVHILPFFDPIDGADAGFDPSDHGSVDPRLGDWSDVQALSEHTPVMADLIVNHVSSECRQFQDVRHRGRESRDWPLFLRAQDVFPDGPTAAELAGIYRPRPGSPFTSIELNDGQSEEFWTTFSQRQLDINVESDLGQAYLSGILGVFAQAGVRYIRLDAAGYAIKRAGTACFMLPETFEFIGSLTKEAQALGIEVLVEIHSHYQTQMAIASRVSRVYDFALPPLVLHTLYTSDAEALRNWLAIAPRNCVTVLDTHDGIGIVDVAGDGQRPGLLGDGQIDALVNEIHRRTNGDSRKASGQSASNLDIYQLNTTFYDALGRADDLYLLARAIQMFVPGVPQVYYVGLLAGANDMALLERTGVGRDINRHYYSRDEIDEAMKTPLVRSLFDLLRLRNASRAFDGDFSMPDGPNDNLSLRWQHDNDAITLHVDLRRGQGHIERLEDGRTAHYRIDSTLRLVR